MLGEYIRPHSGSPFALPAPYPPPGAFTRPLPDSWGLPDSYRSKNQLKITVFGLKSPKKTIFLITMRAIKSFHHYLLCSFLWRFIVKNICLTEHWLFTSEIPITNTWTLWRKRTFTCFNQNDFIPDVGVSCQILFSPMMYLTKSDLSLSPNALNVKINRYPNDSISVHTLWYQIFNSSLCHAMLFCI